MISGGKPMAIMKAVIRIYQAKIGIFARLIPGARAQRMAVINSTAAVTEAISAKVMPISQKSADRSGLYSAVDSGTYMNQPLRAQHRKGRTTAR